MSDGRCSSRMLFATDGPRDGEYGSAHRATRVLFASRVQAVALLRIAHRLPPDLASVVKWIKQALTGSDVASAARLGSGRVLLRPAGVVIGPKVVVGANRATRHSVTLSHGRGPSPTVGENVSFGPDVVVVGGYSISRGSQIGASSVVTCNLPDGQVWVGVPARYLRDVG